MIQLYEDLIGILEKEFSLCVKMLALLQEEKDVIVSLDHIRLESLLGEKEAVAAGIRVCDDSRERILDSLGYKNKSINEVAQLADGAYKERLLAISSKFAAVIQSISELNRFNSMLIEKSLYYVKTSYNFLSGFDINPKQRVSVEA